MMVSTCSDSDSGSGDEATSERTPAPPHGLALVIDFVNTLDVETGADELASVEGISKWFSERGLIERRAAKPSERDRRRAIELREALRELMLAHTDGERVRGAGAALDRASRARECAEGLGLVAEGAARDPGKCGTRSPAQCGRSMSAKCGFRRPQTAYIRPHSLTPSARFGRLPALAGHERRCARRRPQVQRIPTTGFGGNMSAQTRPGQPVDKRRDSQPRLRDIAFAVIAILAMLAV